MLDLHDFPPPPQYDHPYTGLGSVLVEPLDRVRKSCSIVKLRPGDVLYACAWVPREGSGLPCTIVLPEVGGEITQTDQDRLRRMENANCNEWPKDGRE